MTRPGSSDLYHAPSTGRIVGLSVSSAVVVLVASFSGQWLIYTDWLHQRGPLRIVGTTLATLLTFIFAFEWQAAVRHRRLRMLRRFETIARMNDRIRNNLQQIECLAYVSKPNATDQVKQAVNAIDTVLREVIVDMARFETEPMEQTSRMSSKSA